MVEAIQLVRLGAKRWQTSVGIIDVSACFSFLKIDVSLYFALGVGKAVFGHFLSKVGHLLSEVVAFCRKLTFVF